MVYWLFRSLAFDGRLHLLQFEAAASEVDLRGPSVLFHVSKSDLRLPCGLLFGLRICFYSLHHYAAIDHLSARIAPHEGQRVGEQSVADGIFS